MKKYIDMTMPFMDRKEVCASTLKSKSQLYLDTNEGLFPAPVKIGGRRVVYLSCEVNEMIGLWVNQLSNDEIKEKVKLMIASRKLHNLT